MVVQDGTGGASEQPGTDVVALAKPTLLDPPSPEADAALAAMREHARVRVESTHDTDALRATLTSEGTGRVVVLGGDGSVHRVVQQMHDAGVLPWSAPVGLVPLGTGNDLARGVGIPLDPARAAEVAVTGRPQPMAILVDEDGKVAVNVVHAGAGAEAARRTEQSKSLLGRFGYAFAAVVTGLRPHGWYLLVRVDGRVVHDGKRSVLMVAAGLGGTIGGGAPVAPGSDPVDGTAEVTVSLATGALQRLGYAAAMRLGRHQRRRDVVSARGRLVEVEVVRGQAFRTDADGELAGPFRSRTWRLQPEAWPLVVPATGRPDRSAHG